MREWRALTSKVFDQVGERLYVPLNLGVCNHVPAPDNTCVKYTQAV
jgi:hypothetical protein